METTTVSDTKYQKLASEYAKLRAQASVLKKAVLDEQAKSGVLREQLRQRETALRRSEQEVDSLGFRNKQLEQRVGALQEELAIHEGRKREKTHSKQQQQQTLMSSCNDANLVQDALILEEWQRKIMENAQLTSLVDDKERELLLYAERILNLEHKLERRAAEQTEQEKRLRRDLETLQCRNSELETKLVEAASMLGSEDALSVSGSDCIPLHNTHQHNLVTATTSEERIAHLERDVAHWRAQYEIVKLSETFGHNSKEALKPQTTAIANDANCSCSSTAAGLTVQPSYAESKSAQRARDSLKEPPVPPTKEQWLFDQFSRKYEDLLKTKCMTESRMSSYITEAEHLQNCLENATHELKSKDEQIAIINQALQMLEEDLATTRVNYEEQISVLTEQVISLSEQLAACK